MKHERGFSLVELMVVVSIGVLLLAWGIPSYSTWKTKHDIENEMVQFYSDLQLGRMTAYANKVVSGILWGAAASSTSITSYQIMTDVNNTGTIDSGASQVAGTGTVDPKYPIICSADQKSVSFDGRGFLYTANAPDSNNPITFSVNAPLGSAAAINCVYVTSTRITLGKMNAGVCKPK